MGAGHRDKAGKIYLPAVQKMVSDQLAAGCRWNMSWTKVILFNFLNLIFLLVLSEVGIRVVWTLKSCFSGSCDYSFLLNPVVRDVKPSLNMGLSEYHPLLGYVPRANFSSVLNIPGWNSVRLDIDERTFRKNGLPSPRVKPEILAFGDSFTFGDQVSNDQTWPACLQKKSGIGVVNAGVFGYGAAQALRRAKYELEINPYNVLIFSILVPHDFDRDRFDYRSGLPRPSLIKKDDGRIAWSLVPDPNKAGTKFSPLPRSKLSIIYENSLIFSSIYDRLFPLYNFSGSDITSVHPEAAELEEIIEWTLTEFSKINNTKKILLLQYGDKLENEIVLKSRSNVMRVAQSLDLKVVDTYDAIKAHDPKLVWFGHHTPFGNEIVCDLIKKNLH